MMRAVIGWIIVFITATSVLSAQSSIDERKKELDRLRSSIEQTRQRINALNRRESTALRSLSGAQRQQHRLSAFIASLVADLQALQDSAATLGQHIQATQESLHNVEQAYRNATTRLLELRATQKGASARSSTTKELYRRLTASVAAYRRRMHSLADSLAEQRSLLSAYAVAQSEVKSSKEQEQQRLSTSITGSKTELRRLHNDKSALQRELRAKQSSVAKLRAMISALVAKEERERKKRADAAARARADAARRGAKPNVEKPADEVVAGGEPSGGYGARSLPWPTTSRTLLHGYGTYTNRETGTVLENPGIDIKASVGTNVVSVGDGSVTSVSWLPGFGSLVIIDHRNGFRSVYANLATLNVRSGSAVRAGTLVGSSGESIDGELVHFELWRGRERLDPTRYLK